MELLDRYLQAVRKHLPLRRQDDIIAELRANMESQIEDKEAELGRQFTQCEFEDFLRKMGSPVMVASRYQSQQYLIGPTFFPIYLYVLRVVLLWAFVLSVIVSAVVIPLTSPNAGEVFASLFRIPFILIQVAGWVTLVFVVIEFVSMRHPNVCPPIAGLADRWQPSSLPPLDKNAGRAGKPRSFAQAVANIIFGCLFLVWLLLVPRHPFLLMGPGAIYLQSAPFHFAPVLWTFYGWLVALSMLQIVWECIDLARGAWQFPNRIRWIVFQAIRLIPITIMLNAPDHVYILFKDPAVNKINNGIHTAFAVICAITVLQLAFGIGRIAWKAYSNRAAAG
jgi:hypothetical protein